MAPSNCLKMVTVFLFAVSPVAAIAHHSANEFDQSKVVEIDGLIIDVFWRNPHVIIKVAVDMEDPDAVWELEGASVSSLSRRGLSRDMLNDGDFVRAAGYASTRKTNHLLLTQVLLPGGEELLVRRNASPRWTTTAAHGGETALDPSKVAAAEAEADSIFRV